jgi:hypothetical protein
LRSKTNSSAGHASIGNIHQFKHGETIKSSSNPEYSIDRQSSNINDSEFEIDDNRRTDP